MTRTLKFVAMTWYALMAGDVSLAIYAIYACYNKLTMVVRIELRLYAEAPGTLGSLAAQR
jgi:hypothetical protein